MYCAYERVNLQGLQSRYQRHMPRTQYVWSIAGDSVVREGVGGVVREGVGGVVREGVGGVVREDMGGVAREGVGGVMREGV